MRKLPPGLALLAGLLATALPGTAQPAEAPPEPRLELVLGPGFQWMEPGLLLIPFEVRNTGKEPAIVSQQPGMLLAVSCETETGFHGSIPGGIACGPDGVGWHYSLVLGPEQALQGEKVVKVPADCVRDITVEGLFETVTASDWDLPARKTSLRSRPLRIGDPG
jgi:hypothetical protein